jgi:hypothetical protein
LKKSSEGFLPREATILIAIAGIVALVAILLMHRRDSFNSISEPTKTSETETSFVPEKKSKIPTSPNVSSPKTDTNAETKGCPS